jgi:DNA-binding beta-propeller fold protein YncE
MPSVYTDTSAYTLTYQTVAKLPAGEGTKSVVFSTDMTRLYALNLEGLSVFEYSQRDKKLLRIFKFKSSPGTGWDYETDKPIKSLQEKPVEACMSAGDSVLWVSLHNAEGIVPLFLNSNTVRSRVAKSATDKLVYILSAEGAKQDSFYTPLIKTGKTPKVIARTANDKTLLVSNWHSYTVSVLDINPSKYPFATVKKDIAVSSIPRGVVVDDANKTSYVAIMGGASLAKIDNTTWELNGQVSVASNPRHVLMDRKGRLFVSYNKLGQVACVEPSTGKTLFTANTAAQPRTIALSKNGQYLYVTCYKGEMVTVFEVLENSFKEIASMPCKGFPVGIDVFENKQTVEAWVCPYNGGALSIYTFSKQAR